MSGVGAAPGIVVVMDLPDESRMGETVVVEGAGALSFARLFTMDQACPGTSLQQLRVIGVVPLIIRNDLLRLRADIRKIGLAASRFLGQLIEQLASLTVHSLLTVRQSRFREVAEVLAAHGNVGGAVHQLLRGPIHRTDVLRLQLLE